MWPLLWHAIWWIPKIVYWGSQRMAVWTGTLYLFKKGKDHKIYYFLSALLYLSSWVLLILFIRETMTLDYRKLVQYLELKYSMVAHA